MIKYTLTENEMKAEKIEENCLYALVKVLEKYSKKGISVATIQVLVDEALVTYEVNL